MVDVRAVWRVLRDGKARTASEIVREVGAGTTASVTARVRDLRKERWGAHLVVCERVGDSYVYRVVPRVLLAREGEVARA